MFKSSDIEKIIDDVLKSTVPPDQSHFHPINKEDNDANLYSDVDVYRSPVKYIDPIDQRRQ